MNPERFKNKTKDGDNVVAAAVIIPMESTMKNHFMTENQYKQKLIIAHIIAMSSISKHFCFNARQIMGKYCEMK